MRDESQPSSFNLHPFLDDGGENGDELVGFVS
jgi:hypothetical protein